VFSWEGTGLETYPWLLSQSNPALMSMVPEVCWAQVPEPPVPSSTKMISAPVPPYRFTVQYCPSSTAVPSTVPPNAPVLHRPKVSAQNMTSDG
jgi:hypothetical protein